MSSAKVIQNVIEKCEHEKVKMAKFIASVENTWNPFMRLDVHPAYQLPLLFLEGAEKLMVCVGPGNTEGNGEGILSESWDDSVK